MSTFTIRLNKANGEELDTVIVSQEIDIDNVITFSYSSDTDSKKTKKFIMVGDKLFVENGSANVMFVYQFILGVHNSITAILQSDTSITDISKEYFEYKRIFLEPIKQGLKAFNTAMFDIFNRELTKFNQDYDKCHQLKTKKMKGKIWSSGTVASFENKEKLCCRTCKDFTKKLMKCARCFTEYYCSSECQKSDWKRHKVECNRLTA